MPEGWIVTTWSYGWVSERIGIISSIFQSSAWHQTSDNTYYDGYVNFFSPEAARATREI